MNKMALTQNKNKQSRSRTRKVILDEEMKFKR